LESIVVITLGCAKNRVDSEHLMQQISAAGGVLRIAESLDGLPPTDVCLINTCGFIHDAKQESIDSILTAVAAKQEGRIGKVYVFGCLSQRYPQELAREIPEVDGFFGANDFCDILQALGYTWQAGRAHERVLTTPAHYAYLKISEGCDRSCAYCAIPGIRGRHISQPMEALLQEAEHLAAKGVKELLVVAQDTTYYGLDIYKERSLAPLLLRLTEVKGLEWIRLHYTYPAGFPEDVLELMAQHSKICSYLDIPLQHVSTKVLTAMRRGVDETFTRALVAKMRAKVPDICLRTTFIVGHPGEDKRAFKQLLDFVQEARFERMGAFCYSEEEGTLAALQYKDSISAREKQERYLQLMDAQSGIAFAYNQSRIGKKERVLIDSWDEATQSWRGRSQYESPEVDGEIYLRDVGEAPAWRGQFVDACIECADAYDLQGLIYKDGDYTRPHENN